MPVPSASASSRSAASAGADPGSVATAAAHGPWHEFEPLPLTPILTAASAAFEEGGYHGASVRDIAQRVGVTVPTLYYHHGSKQGLLLALLERTMTDLSVRSERALAAAGDDPLHRIVDLVDCTVRFMCHRTATAHLDAQARYLDTEAREVYAAPRDRFERHFGAVLSQGRHEGVFSSEHPVDTTRALLGTFQSVAVWFRPDGPLAAEEVAARHVGFALDALRVERRRRDAGVRRARER